MATHYWTHFVACGLCLLVVLTTIAHCQTRNGHADSARNFQSSLSLGSQRSGASADSKTTDSEPAECYVEVEVTQVRRIPGRCLPVGRRMMPHLCQTKDRQYISLNNGCVEVLEKKSQSTADGP